MNEIKIGDKIRVVGNSRIHHCLLVPSTATVQVVGIAADSFKVYGRDKDGKGVRQWVHVIDIKPIRKAVVL
jgi:UDP-glucose 4-epimerase